MHISIFTPVGSTNGLSRTFRSLLAQNYDDFEWILVPHSDCGSLPADIVSDRRVQVFPAPQLSNRTGALKAHAVLHCSGDLLLDLSVGDMLLTDCLTQLVAARQRLNSDNAFFYSDFAQFSATSMSPLLPDERHGWQQYDVMYEGRLLTARRAFQPCPSSLGWPSYAPRHLRAWTRAAYLAAGGYDTAQDLAPDYDLLLRTYLKRADFVYIPQCLYADAVVSTFPAARERAGNDLANANISDIVREWCRRKKLQTVELSITTNISSRCQQTITPLAEVRPFGIGRAHFQGLSDLPENSVGEIYCDGLLPFLDHRLILPFMAECYRVLAPGGWLRCVVPSTDGRLAFSNPLYSSFWNCESFKTFCEHDAAALAGNTTSRFYMARNWDSWSTMADYEARRIYTYVDLVALKDQQQPGWVRI